MRNAFIIGFFLISSNILLQSQTISLVQEPQISNITTNGFSLNWTTDAVGTTEAFWGYTTSLEQDKLVESGTGTNHQLSISGQNASTLIYIKAFSVSGSDTAFADTQLHITASGSSGDIKVYFNATVDTSKALSKHAVYVEDAIADTLANYINRAGKTVDMAIYNIDYYQGAKIIDALNNAHSRGVIVRVIYNESTTNSGINNLNAAIGKIESPENTGSYGIMHNKFVIIDVESVDSAIVWTGSTNFTSQQLNTDPNDAIILQDKSLAKAYTLEFNEMFGSSGATPNHANSKFGPFKEDNTPHEFNIGGIRVESYFSPSDGTNDKIIDVVNTADNELHIGTMLITRSDIANAIVDKNEEGIDTRMIIDDIDQYTQDNTLVPSLGESFRTMGESGIMHHKYMIVDHASGNSDPQVLTGCHNWSTSARDRNDENTLIVHDQTIANLYFQEFSVRFESGEIVASQPICYADTAEYPVDQTDPIIISVLDNDSVEGNFNLTISTGTDLGNVNILTDQTISYQPKLGFDKGIDTFRYSVCSDEYFALCDEALVTVNVGGGQGTGLNKTSASSIEVYPTSGSGILTLKGLQTNAELSIINTSGKIIHRETLENESMKEIAINLSDKAAGMYYLVVITDKGNHYTKKIIIE